LAVRVIVAVLVAASLWPARADARPAVYGGSMGPTGSVLGPDAFFVTADPATRRLTGLGVTYIAGCLDGVSTPVTVHVTRVIPAASPAGDVPVSTLATSRNAGGRFAGTIVHPTADGGRVEIQVEGRLRARRAAGTIRSLVFSPAGAQTCDTGSHSWRANRRPGRIFAGNLPGTGTVVLTRQGADDMRFHTTVSTTACEPGQPWLVPNIVITAFDIRRGRFDRPVEDTLAGDSATVVYDITGRISRSRASGWFTGRITRLDADRHPLWTCFIVTTRWSAASG
jgi:hypothetical protein